MFFSLVTIEMRSFIEPFVTKIASDAEIGEEQFADRASSLLIVHLAGFLLLLMGRRLHYIHGRIYQLLFKMATSWFKSAPPKNLEEYSSILELWEKKDSLNYIRKQSSKSNLQLYYFRYADSYFLQENFKQAALYYAKSYNLSAELNYLGWGNNEFKSGNYENQTVNWYLQEIKNNRLTIKKQKRQKDNPIQKSVEEVQNCFNALALALGELEDFNDCLQIFSALEPNQSKALNCLKGHIYYNHGKLQLAEQMFKNCGGDYCEALIGLAYINWKKGSTLFQQYLKKAQQINPYPTATLCLALLNTDYPMDKKQKMEVCENQCIAHIAKTNLVMGNLYCLEKKYEEAFEYYRRAIDENPCFEQAYSALGHLFSRQNNLNFFFSSRSVEKELSLESQIQRIDNIQQRQMKKEINANVNLNVNEPLHEAKEEEEQNSQEREKIEHEEYADQRKVKSDKGLGLGLGLGEGDNLSECKGKSEAQGEDGVNVKYEDKEEHNEEHNEEQNEEHKEEGKVELEVEVKAEGRDNNQIENFAEEKKEDEQKNQINEEINYEEQEQLKQAEIFKASQNKQQSQISLRNQFSNNSKFEKISKTPSEMSSGFMFIERAKITLVMKQKDELQEMVNNIMKNYGDQIERLKGIISDLFDDRDELESILSQKQKQMQKLEDALRQLNEQFNATERDEGNIMREKDIEIITAEMKQIDQLYEKQCEEMKKLEKSSIGKDKKILRYKAKIEELQGCPFVDQVDEEQSQLKDSSMDEKLELDISKQNEIRELNEAFEKVKGNFVLLEKKNQKLKQANKALIKQLNQIQSQKIE